MIKAQNMITPRTLKGFRDFLPLEARKRQYVINTLKSVFERYGFEPLETPVLEYEEILSGKYGDEGDQLMYRFEDNGKRHVAMRYDQTVPLARVIAQYENQLSFPFKRYQIQPVWRAENTQKGRYREFVQCDIDTVGTDSPLADAEIIACALESLKFLGLKTRMRINDRKIFDDLDLNNREIIIIDKLNKIGPGNVAMELEKLGRKDAKEILDKLQSCMKTDLLNIIFNQLNELNLIENVDFIFDQTLARGLNYYNNCIYEIELIEENKFDTGEMKPTTVLTPKLSLGGGGRYNNLIGMFANGQIPAVGLAFGFDRIIEAMDELNLFPEEILNSSTKVLVTIFSEELKEKSLEITSKLRDNNINTEIYLGEIKDKNPLEKQLKYADAKKIPYVLILGPQEAEKNIVTLRNMQTRDQQEGSLDEILSTLTL